VDLLYNIVLGAGCLVAFLFIALVYFTGKGDAMSGGTGSVRTTFKGKASIEDQISKLTLYMGIAFMAFMLVLDIISIRQV